MAEIDVPGITEAFLKLQRAFSDDGPGLRYQLWKLCKLVEEFEESRERKPHDE